MNPIDYRSHKFLAVQINNRIVREHLAVMRGRVVDLGCGTAPYKEAILGGAEEYIGVDWPSSLHEQSRVNVFANIAEGLPFPDSYADTVVAFQVLEHLPDSRRFLAECHRILRPGGQLLLTIPFMWQVHEAPHDYVRYTRYGLDYLLRQSGFATTEIKENTGFWQTWVLKFTYHTTRFARGPLVALWIPLWWVAQNVAPLLDRLDPHPQETASYTVLATR